MTKWFAVLALCMAASIGLALAQTDTRSQPISKPAANPNAYQQCMINAENAYHQIIRQCPKTEAECLRDASSHHQSSVSRCRNLN